MFLRETMEQKIQSGKKCLVPYITGGLKNYTDMLKAAVDNGADALEVGIPFSDPVMDGPVIAEASRQALENGATPGKILEETAKLDLTVPVVVMTYYNIALQSGLKGFAAELKKHNISGAILADMPLEESLDWKSSADSAGIASILLAAPTADDERLKKISRGCSGFIYAVGLLGVTGERKNLAKSALEIAERLKVISDLPVLTGVGISNPGQAVQACQISDGVIVGSAIVRKILEDAKPSEIGSFVASFRKHLDS